MATLEGDRDGTALTRRGRTTVELFENDRGEWLATQRGVDATGRGETAVAAVARYCEALERAGSE